MRVSGMVVPLLAAASILSRSITKTGVLSVAKACPLPTLRVRLTGGSGAPATVTTGIDISKNC